MAFLNVCSVMRSSLKATEGADQSGLLFGLHYVPGEAAGVSGIEATTIIPDEDGGGFLPLAGEHAHGLRRGLGD